MSKDRSYHFSSTTRSVTVSHYDSPVPVSVIVTINIGRETYQQTLQFETPLAARDFVGRCAADNMLNALNEAERTLALEAYRRYNDTYVSRPLVAGRLLDTKA